MVSKAISKLPLEKRKASYKDVEREWPTKQKLENWNDEKG